MNNVKTIIQKNIFQIIVGLVLAISNLLTFYTSFQLFQQSTNFKVAALQVDITDIKTSIKTLSGISAKVDVINAKVDEIMNRADRQGDTLKTLLFNK